MIGQYRILKKLQAGIMIALTALALLGFAGQGQEMEEPSVEGSISKIPKNVELIGSSADIVSVDIHGEGEYRAFVNSLEKYRDCFELRLDMKETDTVVYLDEILAYHNFSYLSIFSGGVIAVRNMDNLKETPLEVLELNRVHAIEENVVSQLPAWRDVEIRLDSDYTGVFPAKDLAHNTNCANIAMIWEDNKKYEAHLEELAEWDEINASMSENDSYLKGLYVWNEGEDNYISYEFCEEETEQACAAFICIKDRESYGGKYCDILDVPVQSVDVTWSGGRRMWRDDLNFDGYSDLVFMGWNMFSGDRPRQCIGFLWNEEEQKIENEK